MTTFAKHRTASHEISSIKSPPDLTTLFSWYKSEFVDNSDKIITQKETEFLRNFFTRVNLILNQEYEQFNESITFLKTQKECEKKTYLELYKPMHNLCNETYQQSTRHYNKLNKRDNTNWAYLTNFIQHCNYNQIPIHTCKGRFILVYETEFNTSKKPVYTVCIGCGYCYHVSSIWMFCINCKKEFYSSVVCSNEKLLPPATWDKYHCNVIMNEQMSCIKCKDKFWLSNGNWYCKKCKYLINPKDLIWKCVLCSKDFKSGAKIHNSLEYKIMKLAMKTAFLYRKIVKPKEIPCGCYRYNTWGRVEFNHMVKGCDGVMFHSYLGNREVVVCSKCRAMSTLNKFKWRCPKCSKEFISKDITVALSALSDESGSRQTVRKGQENVQDLCKTSEKDFDKGVDDPDPDPDNDNNKTQKKCRVVFERSFSINTIGRDDHEKRKNNQITNIKIEVLKNCNDNAQKVLKVESDDRENSQSNINRNPFQSEKSTKNRNWSINLFPRSHSKPGKENNDDDEDNEDERNDIKRKINFYHKQRKNRNHAINAISVRQTQNENGWEDKAKVGRFISNIPAPSLSKGGWNYQQLIPKMTIEMSRFNTKSSLNSQDQNGVWNWNRTWNQDDLKVESRSKGGVNRFLINTESWSKEKQPKKNVVFNHDEQLRRDRVSSYSKHNQTSTKYKNTDLKIERNSHNISWSNNIDYIANSSNNSYWKEINHGKGMKYEYNNKAHKAQKTQNDNDILISPGCNATQHEDSNKPQASIASEPQEFNIDDYTIITQLGQGTFGKIYLVEDKNKQIYSMKKIIWSEELDLQSIMKEYRLARQLKHENIIKIVGMYTNKLDSTTYGIYILMEVGWSDWEKEIKSHIDQHRYYAEKDLIGIWWQLVSGLSFLQSKNISHRDIKPQNVWVFKNKIYKIADFGEAKEISKINQKKEINTLTGTEMYMSPLLFNGLKTNQLDIKHNLFKSDVYSLGLCMIYAATLNWNAIYELRKMVEMSNVRLYLEMQFQSRYGRDFREWWGDMLEINEKNRPDFVELMTKLKDF